MGVKISALPSIITPTLTDVFPVSQNGVTYKETVQQLSTLLGTVSTLMIFGTANQVIASSPTGNVTLSLPQSIATTSSVTFGSLAFSPTTQGIVGTATNDSAGAGYVGQIVSSVIPSASSISISNHTATDLTSISLSAGDWNVWGNITFLSASSTSVTNTASWVSKTSATLPDSSLFASHIFNAVVGGATATFSEVAPMLAFSLATTTTIYVSGFCQFTASTMTMCGAIYARRIR